jgi:hypothetical protein
MENRMIKIGADEKKFGPSSSLASANWSLKSRDIHPRVQKFALREEFSLVHQSRCSQFALTKHA